MASEEDIQGTKDAVIQDLERKLRFKEDVLNNGQPVPGVCGLSRGRGESGAAPPAPCCPRGASSGRRRREGGCEASAGRGGELYGERDTARPRGWEGERAPGRCVPHPPEAAAWIHGTR